MSRIRKIVADYHLKSDEEAARRVNCIYTRLTVLKAKEYKFDERISKIGLFQNTDHRCVFLQAILESDKYEKDCRNCEQRVMNFTKHGMEECKAVEHQRKTYKLKMRFYNDTEKRNLKNVDEVIREAMRSKCIMKVVCDFLIVIWNWTCEDKGY